MICKATLPLVAVLVAVVAAERADTSGSRSWSSGMWDTEVGWETWNPKQPWTPPYMPPTWTPPPPPPPPPMPMGGKGTGRYRPRAPPSPAAAARKNNAMLAYRNIVYCYLGPSHTVPMQYISPGLCDHVVVWGVWVDNQNTFFDEMWLGDVVKWRDEYSPETGIGIGVGGSLANSTAIVLERLAYLVENYPVEHVTIDTQDDERELVSLLKTELPSIFTIMAVAADSVTDSETDLVLVKTDWPEGDPTRTFLDINVFVSTITQNANISADRIILSIPTFGKSFVDLGNGAFAALDKRIAYPRVCDMTDAHSIVDRRRVVPVHTHTYADRGRVVTVYNDPYSIKHQADSAIGLTGAIALFLGYDDYFAVCGGATMPLLKAAVNV